ncbi:hypothetical protein BHM03_00054023 [Ensete ventricosum]|nr:hypothetical protein BHM03_00054023 [Ensete ventricosum]
MRAPVQWGLPVPINLVQATVICLSSTGGDAIYRGIEPDIPLAGLRGSDRIRPLACAGPAVPAPSPSHSIPVRPPSVAGGARPEYGGAPFKPRQPSKPHPTSLVFCPVELGYRRGSTGGDGKSPGGVTPRARATSMAGRRAGSGVVVLCLVLLMSFSLCFDCRKVAIRTFPADSNAYGRERRPVIGRRPVPIGAPMLPATAEGDGLEESKRRVPSCPDPLHNR